MDGMSYGYFPQQASEYLEQELSQRKMRRPSYSLRAFARDIGMSPSTLSELFNQKVGLSREKALHIARKMKLDDAHQNHFCDLIQARHARKETDRSEAKIRSRARVRSLQNQLSQDQFRTLADWYHLAALELIDMNAVYGVPAKMAKALGITIAEAGPALERLERQGLVRYNEVADRYEASSSSTTVGDGEASEAVRKFHLDLMDKAKEALVRLPVEKREFQSTVMSLRSEDEAEFKKDLNKMMTALIDKYYHKTGKDRLFAVCHQMFPLMKESAHDVE